MKGKGVRLLERSKGSIHWYDMANQGSRVIGVNIQLVNVIGVHRKQRKWK